jgi:hypothetical protein
MQQKRGPFKGQGVHKKKDHQQLMVPTSHSHFIYICSELQTVQFLLTGLYAALCSKIIYLSLKRLKKRKRERSGGGSERHYIGGGGA